MAKPTLAIDLAVIAHNTQQIVARCLAHGVSVCAVTKATCGSPVVARTMLKAGATMLGESRLDNVRRLRRNGINCPIMMLRIPPPSEAANVVKLCDISLNSELTTLQALSAAAERLGKTHKVIIMLEMGDRREGVALQDLPDLCEQALQLPGLQLVGLGANFMCVNGILPSAEKLQRLAAAAADINQRFAIKLSVISGGNSTNLPTLDSQPPPAALNQLRIGASILLGEDTINGGTLPWLKDNAFELVAELIEIQRKDSLPEGEQGRDAFGEVPVVNDQGEQIRGIVNLGRLDIRKEGLQPCAANVNIIAASSDHLLVDLTHAHHQYRVGDKLTFHLDYGALIQAMLSPYIDKRLVGRETIAPPPQRLRIYARPAMLAHPVCVAFLQQVAALDLQVAHGGNIENGDLPLYIANTRANEPQLNDAELGVLVVDSEPGDIAHLQPENAAMLGLQKANEEQANLIHDNQLVAFTMEDIDLMGIQEVTQRALRRISDSTDGFALVLHSSAATGMTDDPLQAGLSYRECSLVMERIAASTRLRAITLSGVNADMPHAMLNNAFNYLLSALGKTILSSKRGASQTH